MNYLYSRDSDYFVDAHPVQAVKFDSAYKADVKSTYDPPMEGMREASTLVEGKWLGPCKPGQKPGDISIPGMPNIKDMIKGPPKKP